MAERGGGVGGLSCVHLADTKARQKAILAF